MALFLTGFKSLCPFWLQAGASGAGGQDRQGGGVRRKFSAACQGPAQEGEVGREPSWGWRDRFHEARKVIFQDLTLLASRADKFTFIPSDPQVAHILPCAPEANAGSDVIVFDEAILDGSQSTDKFSTLDNFQWQLNHRTNSDYNQTVYGEIVTVTDLKPGFYDVVLTVENVDGIDDTDEMFIAATGLKGDFDQDGDVDGADLTDFSKNFGTFR